MIESQEYKLKMMDS